MSSLSKNAPQATADNDNFSAGLIVWIPYPGLAEYRGTRAQLEAEGLIPEGFNWPDGYGDHRWTHGDFRFWLMRRRPDGAKGYRNQFSIVVWWHLRFDPQTTESHVVREVKRRTKEIDDYVYKNSDAGLAALRLHHKRYEESLRDEKFWAFKALVPGLIKPKRTRQPKQA